MDEHRKRFLNRPRSDSEPPSPVQKFIAEHTVAAGETLGAISLKYYGSAAKDKYMQIYEANKAAIGENPNMLRVGTVLKIPGNS